MPTDHTTNVARAAELAALAQDELRHAVVNARKAGLSLRQIADLTGQSHETIRRWVNAFMS
jgi:transposase